MWPGGQGKKCWVVRQVCSVCALAQPALGSSLLQDSTVTERKGLGESRCVITSHISEEM
jgi:hypothetical protein